MRSETRTQSFTGQFLYERDRQSGSAEKMFGVESEGVVRSTSSAFEPFFAKPALMVANRRSLWSLSPSGGFYFLPDEGFPVVEKRGRGAGKQSFHCRSAFRKRRQ